MYTVFLLANDKIIEKWTGCKNVEYEDDSNSIRSDSDTIIGFRGEVIITEGDPGNIPLDDLKKRNIKLSCLRPEIKEKKQQETIEEQEKTISEMNQLLMKLLQEVEELKKKE